MMNNLQSTQVVKSYSFYNLITVPVQIDQLAFHDVEIGKLMTFWEIIHRDDNDVIVSKTVKMV